MEFASKFGLMVMHEFLATWALFWHIFKCASCEAGLETCFLADHHNYMLFLKPTDKFVKSSVESFVRWSDDIACFCNIVAFVLTHIDQMRKFRSRIGDVSLRYFQSFINLWFCKWVASKLSKSFLGWAIPARTTVLKLSIYLFPKPINIFQSRLRHGGRWYRVKLVPLKNNEYFPSRFALLVERREANGASSYLSGTDASEEKGMHQHSKTVSRQALYSICWNDSMP